MWWAWKGIQYSLCVGGLAKIPHSLIMGLISKYPMCYMWGELKRIHSAITRGGLERDPPNPKCEWLIKRSPHVLRVGARNGDSLPFTCGGLRKSLALYLWGFGKKSSILYIPTCEGLRNRPPVMLYMWWVWKGNPSPFTCGGLISRYHYVFLFGDFEK